MSPAPKPIDESTYSGRFAARLRMLREKAGLSVEDVVASLAVHGHEMAVRSYYHWEQGRRDPPISLFPALASSLKVKSVRALLPSE